MFAMNGPDIALETDSMFGTLTIDGFVRPRRHPPVRSLFLTNSKAAEISLRSLASSSFDVFAANPRSCRYRSLFQYFSSLFFLFFNETAWQSSSALVAAACLLRNSLPSPTKEHARTKEVEEEVEEEEEEEQRARFEYPAVMNFFVAVLMLFRREIIISLLFLTRFGYPKAHVVLFEKGVFFLYLF